MTIQSENLKITILEHDDQLKKNIKRVSLGAPYVAKALVSKHCCKYDAKPRMTIRPTKYTLPLFHFHELELSPYYYAYYHVIIALVHTGLSKQTLKSNN